MDKEFFEILTQMTQADTTDDDVRHAAQTANYLEKNLSSDTSCERLFMPAYLKDQMLNRVHQPDIQTKQSVRRISKRLELFLYGCKVTAAVTASLLIMFSSTVLQNHPDTVPDFISTQTKQRESHISGDIMKHLNKGSYHITNWLQSVSGILMGRDNENE